MIDLVRELVTLAVKKRHFKLIIKKNRSIYLNNGFRNYVITCLLRNKDTSEN